MAAPFPSLLPGGELVGVGMGAVAIGLAVGATRLTRRAGNDARRKDRQRRGLASRRDLARAFPAKAGTLVVGRPARGGPPIGLPAELSLGMVMGPRTGKSSSCVGHILDAPGPVLATSSKPELLLTTAAAREKTTGRPVLAFDPLDLCGWPDAVRWDPIRGCEDPEVAMRRAEAFMAGTDTSNVTNGGFWKSAGTMLLRCALHACAVEGASVVQLREWVADPIGSELDDVLRGDDVAAGWLHEAEMLTRQHGETLGSVALTTGVALSCLALPRVVEACTPGSDADAFEPGSWLASGGTVHVIAPDAEAASVAPLTAAFVDEVVVAARRMAVRCVGGRLSPPLRLVLDELPNVAPLPKVVSYVSDGGGRGIQLVWAAQSRHQLVQRFGSEGAAVLLDASSVLLVSGGLNDAEFLRSLSAALGQVEVRHRTISAGQPHAPGWSEQVRDMAVMEPADIFRLPAFEALLVAGGVGGAVVRVEPWWKRRDGREIEKQAAAAVARTEGQVA